MALTKSSSSAVSSQSSASGSAQDAVISSAIDLTGAYQAVIHGKVTNGATGPTVGCTVNVYISKNNWTDPYLFASITAGVANSGVYPFTFVLPDATSYAKIGFGGNTAQAVTVVADVMTITAI